MYLLIFLLLLPHAIPHAKFAGKITEEENERLKANCGAHYLDTSGTVEKSMPGNRVPVNKYPWIASVMSSVGDCTGVQISSRHILTAAHCVVEQKPEKEYNKICDEVMRSMRWGFLMDDQANLKELIRYAYDKTPPEQFTIYASSSCKHLQQCNDDQLKFSITKPPHVHEQYNPCLYENDLAIIELDRNIPSDAGTPICMINKDDHLGRKLTAIGYGRDLDSYVYALAASHNNMHGSDVLEEISMDSHSVIASNSQLHALLFEKTLCQGDSGGPLVQNDRENRFSVVGIVSTARHNCSVPFAEEYVRQSNFVDVRSYVDWICTSTGVCPIKKMGSHGDHTNYPSEWIRENFKNHRLTFLLS